MKTLKETVKLKKKVIGPKCFYHDKPLSWHPYKKKWECPLCNEEDENERIQNQGYSD